MLKHTLLLPIFSLALLTACQSKKTTQPIVNGAFAKAKKSVEGENLSRIVDSGELIVGTISGPDTYFDYQGRGMGLQYALAEDFASTLGVGVRIVLANDSTELIKQLKHGDIDLIAYPLSTDFCQAQGVEAAGANNDKKHTSWAILNKEDDLAEALNDWYGEGVELKAQRTENTWVKNRTVVRRKVHAPYISREKGIISTYDEYFKEAARHTGWDWRLIAAQCYQESAFDPNAVSWAGACGLMQIMPATAQQFGLPQAQRFSPTENIATAARIIRYLQGQFSSIADPQERAKFVLASYNGGIGHIRDAQALTRKYGGNPENWNDVSTYVRGLSTAKYYRDPVVKHGYMIGSETYGYVQSIMERWQQYGGSVRNLTAGSALQSATNSTGRVPHKKNRFSKEQHILSPEEMEKNMRQEN